MIADESQPIDLRCEGCGNIMLQTPTPGSPSVVKLCRVYIYPEAKWGSGNCVMATHLKKKSDTETKALDPIKKSKRAMKGK